MNVFLKEIIHLFMEVKLFSFIFTMNITRHNQPLIKMMINFFVMLLAKIKFDTLFIRKNTLGRLYRAHCEL